MRRPAHVTTQQAVSPPTPLPRRLAPPATRRLLRAAVPVLLTCAMAGATPAPAEASAGWVPARWDGGPLELQRRASHGALPASADVQRTVREWYDPRTLDLLQGTPINCLLVTWSVGADPDLERTQQSLVAAYARAAQARGIVVLGIVHAPAPAAGWLEPALAAGLDGLILEGTFADGDRLAADAARLLRVKRPGAVVVVPASWSKVSASSDIVAINDAVAPGLLDLADETEATPSSEPWLESNLWLVQSARAVTGSRPIWLMASPSPQALTTADYQRAAAEAVATGSRWVLALDDTLRHGLRTKQPDARAAWEAIAAVLALGRDQAAWSGAAVPLAVAGFVQDNAGADRDTSGANLRLTVRARVPLTVIGRRELDASALAGLRAVHAVDLSEPAAAERSVLIAFAEAGGLVLVGPSWQPGALPVGRDFAILPAGRGRIAVCSDGLDPAELARVFVDLLGRDQLGVRLFRAAAVLPHASIDGRTRDASLHLVNYASYPAESVLVRIAGAFRKATLHRPGSPPEELAIEQSAGYVEITLGRLPVYGVVRLESKEGGA